MGNDGDSKPEEILSFYSAQVESLSKKALSSTDEAITTARVQINHLNDASSQYSATIQKYIKKAQQQYNQYEGLFFEKLKEGVLTATQYPKVTCGVLGVTTLLALRSPRHIIYRYTIGWLQSEQAMLARASSRVKEMHQTLAILKNETKKLEERAKFAEEELLRGKTKLKNSGNQLHSLSRSAFRTESAARGLTDNLGHLPKSDASRLRAEVFAMTSEVKQQRNILEKRVSKIAGYGIPV